MKELEIMKKKDISNYVEIMHGKCGKGEEEQEEVCSGRLYGLYEVVGSLGTVWQSQVGNCLDLPFHG